MTRFLEFDSGALSADEGFEAYRRLYAGGSDVARGAGPFRARLRASRVDGLILYERELNGVIHQRSDRVARDGFDHFAAHLVVSGELKGSPESRFARAGPGDLVLVDTRRPSRTEAIDLHLLTASLPRAAVAGVTGSTARLHGAIVGAPHTEVLGDMMSSLIDHAPALPARAHAPLRRALIEILGTALAELTGPARRDVRSDLDAREAAVAFIMEHLGDRTLNADTVAAGVGSSRSSIYRAFAPFGGLAEFVMSRRLAAVRDALEAGSAQPLSALALAYGFSDESHLNRRFNKAFGRSAGAYRKAMATGANPVEAGASRIKAWVSGID